MGKGVNIEKMELKELYVDQENVITVFPNEGRIDIPNCNDRNVNTYSYHYPEKYNENNLTFRVVPYSQLWIYIAYKGKETSLPITITNCDNLKVGKSPFDGGINVENMTSKYQYVTIARLYYPDELTDNLELVFTVILLNPNIKPSRNGNQYIKYNVSSELPKIVENVVEDKLGQFDSLCYNYVLEFEGEITGDGINKMKLTIPDRYFGRRFKTLPYLLFYIEGEENPGISYLGLDNITLHNCDPEKNEYLEKYCLHRLDTVMSHEYEVGVVYRRNIEDKKVFKVLMFGII